MLYRTSHAGREKETQGTHHIDQNISQAQTCGLVLLTNEKYTGNSVYGETESADFPSTKRTVRDPFEVHRSRNHHPAIIPEYRFKRVQKLKAKRSNIEVDEHGNKVRKSTHYSSKKASNRAKKATKPQN